MSWVIEREREHETSYVSPRLPASNISTMVPRQGNDCIKFASEYVRLTEGLESYFAFIDKCVSESLISA